MFRGYAAAQGQAHGGDFFGCGLVRVLWATLGGDQHPAGGWRACPQPTGGLAGIPGERAGGAALSPEQQATVRRRYNGYVKQGLAAHLPPATPPGRRKTKRSKAAALVERLVRWCDDVLRFITDRPSPSTIMPMGGLVGW
ncbi:MAG: hypothetical protein ACRDYX_07125 [Egibacteraceae bacterium]